MTKQPSFVPRPVFADEELDLQRRIAIQRFIDERKNGGDVRYRKAFAEYRGVVEQLFRATAYLRNLDGAVLRDNPALLEAARFLVAPPVSEDDLDTLVGHRVAGRKRLPAELAQSALDVLGAMIDVIRCPWLTEGREPTQYEAKEAVDWTTGLLAVEQLRTERRTESAKRQQDAVAHLLLSCGWLEDARTTTNVVDGLPRGHFCRETEVAGAKCDVPIRLQDGRLLALECKVSNSGTNSVKRLIRETCGKADLWRHAFGEQVITGAVLSGVFKLKNLREAQNDRGVALFWEHDLSRLEEFVRA